MRFFARPCRSTDRAPKPASDRHHGKAHAKQGHGPTRSREEPKRDRNDRRDRKGNAVWSNSAAPAKYRKRTKPAAV